MAKETERPGQPVGDSQVRIRLDSLTGSPHKPQPTTKSKPTTTFHSNSQGVRGLQSNGLERCGFEEEEMSMHKLPCNAAAYTSRLFNTHNRTLSLSPSLSPSLSFALSLSPSLPHRCMYTHRLERFYSTACTLLCGLGLSELGSCGCIYYAVAAAELGQSRTRASYFVSS